MGFDYTKTKDNHLLGCQIPTNEPRSRFNYTKTKRTLSCSWNSLKRISFGVRIHQTKSNPFLGFRFLQMSLIWVQLHQTKTEPTLGSLYGVKEPCLGFIYAKTKPSPTIQISCNKHRLGFYCTRSIIINLTKYYQRILNHQIDSI